MTKANKTAWAVTCRTHGKQYLTEAQYDQQLSHPDDRWFCPVCGAVSEWDDENYDSWHEAAADEAADDTPSHTCPECGEDFSESIYEPYCKRTCMQNAAEVRDAHASTDEERDDEGVEP